MVERLSCASIAIINKVRIGAAELARLPDLKLIALAATGSDNLDLEACRAANVAVCNIRNYSGPSVPRTRHGTDAGLVSQPVRLAPVPAGGALAAERPVLFDHPITDLHGKRLGDHRQGHPGTGPGAEGPAPSAWRSSMPRPGRRPPGMTTGTLEALLQSSDVISLHCPLTPYTRHLIGERELAMMKPGALLINVGRGGLVDEQALLEALGQRSPRRRRVRCGEHRAARPRPPLMQALRYPTSS